MPTATDADIKKAWHEQLQVWHPDRFNHSPTLHRKAEARTQLINQAYQTLSDPVARARYDATTQPRASHRPPPRPSPAPGPASESYASTTHALNRAHDPARIPAALDQSSCSPGKASPKPWCRPFTCYVDPREHFPYDFHGFVRIAGVIREPLPAGSYAIAEAPELMCIKCIGVEELYTIYSNPSDNRLPFLHELEQFLAFPFRYLVIEGTLQHRKAGGRLNQYHKIGLIDFLDALTARYGIQIIYTDSREEAEERVANLAALHYAYYFAEQQGFGRCLKENDL